MTRPAIPVLVLMAALACGGAPAHLFYGQRRGIAVPCCLPRLPVQIT